MVNLLSPIKDVYSGLKYVGLVEYRIPFYRNKANQYLEDAILQSLVSGFHIDSSTGKPLIDVRGGIEIAVDGSAKIEFSRNTDGLYFARIEQGQYYPIDLQPAEKSVKEFNFYQNLADNSWRRMLIEPLHVFRGFMGINVMLERADNIIFTLGRMELMAAMATEIMEADSENKALESRLKP